MDTLSCAQCSLHEAAATSAIAMCSYLALFLLSRPLTRWLFPATAASLARTPGQLGYWDSSFVSALNGFVNVALCVVAVVHEPALLTSTDGFFKTPETCRVSVLFLSWCSFELMLQLLHWDLEAWKTGKVEIIVHHVSAIVAWALYLEGGYAHQLSLVGVFCEATNPFMNFRWMLSKLGLKNSRLYFVNGLLFCFSWLLVRIAFALPAATWLLIAQWHSYVGVLPVWRLALLVGFVGVGTTLNLMWGWKILHGATQVLNGSGTAADKHD